MIRLTRMKGMTTLLFVWRRNKSARRKKKVNINNKKKVHDVVGDVRHKQNKTKKPTNS